ncbi:MAG: hypothetical protein V4530_00910 [Pseudomonadota bacterium]|jgi:hypothetical protein
MNKPPTWFWIVAVLAILWECMGCMSYLQEVTMTPAQLAAMPVEQRDIWLMMPSWLFGVFAIAVWIGLAGAIALLLRKRLARSLFIVSLVAIVVQFGWVFTQTPILQKMSFGEAAGLPIAIFVIGAVLVWFAGFATKRGWLS